MNRGKKNDKSGLKLATGKKGAILNKVEITDFISRGEVKVGRKRKRSGGLGRHVKTTKEEFKMNSLKEVARETWKRQRKTNVGPQHQTVGI